MVFANGNFHTVVASDDVSLVDLLARKLHQQKCITIGGGAIACQLVARGAIGHVTVYQNDNDIARAINVERK